MGLLRCLGLYTIVIFKLSFCRSSAEYEIFPGFDLKAIFPNTVTSSPSTTTLHTTAKTSTSWEEIQLPEISTMASTETTMTKTTTTTQVPLLNIAPYKPYVCPEEEVPLSIGPYEVPTQKDLVVHMKKILMKMFKSYHKKALFFLNDVMKATRATSQIERSCPIKSRNTYKLCVRHVSNQCQVITKSFVTSLERQRHDVSAFTEASICNMSSMKADPVQLIKTIAMEDASLEFALPGFLRLLGACSVYCQRTPITAHWKKPKRHMTDQDLVIKHFLTRKNYAQLLKEHLT